jgi:SAM-dependent methyltransferase
VSDSIPPLGEVSARTIAHYEAQAESFWQGTRDHDVRQNIAALLDNIKVPIPLEILDFGCGPGRDLKTFADLGHNAIGLDGALSFVEMARKFSGCEVWQQDFLALELPAGRFDGIFANAVLFHVPSDKLPRVLEELHSSLRQDGVLFTSNPRGQNEEGWSGERYANYNDLNQWQRYLCAAGFVEIIHYYRPAGLPRAQQPWLASVWRKI